MKTFAIIVVFLISLKPVLPVVDYIINYDYITRVLCENKAKPELKCNGKCQLMKNLAKVADEEKPISPLKKGQIQETELLFFQELPMLTFKSKRLLTKNKIDDHYSNNYFHLGSCSVFHPPSSLV